MIGLRRVFVLTYYVFEVIRMLSLLHEKKVYQYFKSGIAYTNIHYHPDNVNLLSYYQDRLFQNRS